MSDSKRVLIGEGETLVVKASVKRAVRFEVEVQPPDAPTRPPIPIPSPPDEPWEDDLRAELPYNPLPDEPWLAARNRADWWKRTPDQVQRVTIHHIGSEASARNVAAYITRPQSQGGKGLPRTQYHFHIRPDGEVIYCLDLLYGAWHDSGGDKNTGVSVALQGALHVHKPTIAQLAAAVELTAWLMEEYEIGAEAVDGHDEWARKFVGRGTQCPGWTTAKWRADFFRALDALRVDAAMSFSANIGGGLVDPTEMAALQRGK